MNTYAHRLLEALRRHARLPALRWKEDGAWRDLSFRDLEERVLSCAAALRARGIDKGDRAAIWLETTWPWIVTDLALQLLGAVTTTIYHTLPAGQAESVLRDSGAKALLSNAARLRTLAHVPPLAASSDGGPLGIPFDELLREGRRARETNLDLDRALRDPPVGPDDVSAIVYTSGTTGEPKGAVLTHRNVLANADGATACFRGGPGRRLLLHLPLAHVMARNTATCFGLFTGSTIALAEPEREKLPQNLVETAPHAFITVPYLLDKFMARVREMISGKRGVARVLADRALRLGRARLRAIDGGGPVRPVRDGLELALLDRLVLRKIRARLGGNLEYIVIGGSNSNRESVEFFWSLGIQIYEGYGATELTNSATFTWHGDIKLGTVGHAAPGMEVQLGEDGEVMVRGPNVMKGYWNRPEATADVLDAQGFYHTGDIGVLDAQGYLQIVDRKKEIFALSTGKKVAPQAIENALKLSPCIANACAIGDRQRYMTALVVPDLAVIGERLATNGNRAPLGADDPRVRELVRSEVARVLGALAQFERPKRIRVLAEPFSQENAMLTPTLKLRRKEIAQRYEQEIASLYDESARDVLEV